MAGGGGGPPSRRSTALDADGSGARPRWRPTGNHRVQPMARKLRSRRRTGRRRL